MDDLDAFKATLVVSSGISPEGAYKLDYSFDPPMAEVIEKLGEDNVPQAYQFMCWLIEKHILPMVVFNERYEAQLLEEDDEGRTLN